jgi:hypothetical protein
MKRVLVVVALTFAADLLLVGAAFLWVAIWSHLLHPGLDAAAYQAYAAVASPWVSVFAGVPLFYVGAKAAARRWGGSTVAGVVGLYIAVDVMIVAVFADDPFYGFVMSASSFATKIAAAWAGARAA